MQHVARGPTRSSRAARVPRTLCDRLPRPRGGSPTLREHRRTARHQACSKVGPGSQPGPAPGILAGVNEPFLQRCSGFARSEELDPAGTAGSYRGYVALEVPLPWPREVTEHAEIAPAAAALKARGLRLQGVVPGPDRSPEHRWMATFVRPTGPFDRYRAATWSVPAGAVTDALLGFAEAAGPPPTAAAGTGPVHTGAEPAPVVSAGPARRVSADEDAGRHVLVCTHGARDTCCGSLGTRLSTALPGLGAGVRVWRTSHTGGHRFAPTAVLLPEGTVWAYLDLDTLVGVSDRTLDPGEAASRYRGCTGLDGAEVQAVEREALRTVGWSWLDHRRRGTILERDGEQTRVRLDGVAPGGARTSFEATVEVARLVPVPDCGKPVDQSAKSAPELRVRDFVAA